MCYGIEWGGVPAIRYSLISLGASGVYAPLATGVVLDFIGIYVDTYYFQSTITASGAPVFLMKCTGWNDVQSGTPDYNFEWEINIQSFAGIPYNGYERAMYPHCISGWPDVVVFPDTGPNLLIPNPVEIIPRIWNYPLDT